MARFQSLSNRFIMMETNHQMKSVKQVTALKAMSTTTTLDHPLVDCLLTILRRKETRPAAFRKSVGQLAQLLAYEATKDLLTVDVPIETPVQPTTGQELTQTIGVVPIIRAGIAMVDPVLELIPNSEVWHLGFYRDEETALPVHYYSKLPESAPVDVALIVDPMLATGGSAVMAMEEIKNWGVKQIKMLSIVAAPEGIANVHNNFPDVDIFSCVVDDHLNENKYIVPGLGDAGDRIFNTLR
jgi:uracil phosphoribosyltransferase